MIKNALRSVKKDTRPHRCVRYRRPSSNTKVRDRDRSSNSAYLTISPVAVTMRAGRFGFVSAWAPGYINTSLDVAFQGRGEIWNSNGIAATEHPRAPTPSGATGYIDRLGELCSSRP